MDLFGPLPAIAKDNTTDTAGQYVDDATITTKVKAAFAEDKLVKFRDISVRTDHGVVDLTGTVNSKAESDRATSLATKVKAVSAVHNYLKVTPRKPTRLSMGSLRFSHRAPANSSDVSPDRKSSTKFVISKLR